MFQYLDVNKEWQSVEGKTFEEAAINAFKETDNVSDMFGDCFDDITVKNEKETKTLEVNVTVGDPNNYECY